MVGKSDRHNTIGTWWYSSPPFEHVVLAKDDFTITYINEEGITMRERKDNPLSSMPQFVHYPVETREEFRTVKRT
ncbi:MAG: hypothetical protein GXY52_00375 [Chloroflexi bacterium]|nr:hypothetical protein [Chloroflexota bacterium]